MANLRDLLLLICLIGGVAGVVQGLARRDSMLAMMGLIVMALSTSGLFA